MDLNAAREYERAVKAAAERERELEAIKYLPETPFTEPAESGDYSIEVNGLGVIIYSECCADTMSVETAHKVYEALGRYLDAQSTQTL
jgi:hypothetical protein